MKKIVSILLAMIMLLAIAAPAMAANTNAHTITLKYAKADHIYTAYRIFEGDISNGVLTNIEWSNGVKGAELLAALKADATLGANFADCKTAEAVADVVAEYENDSDMLVAFSRIVAENLGNAAGISVQGAADESGVYTYTIEVVGDGYYFVMDTAEIAEGDAATKYILQVLKDVNIAAKADAPTLEKKIVENDAFVDANEGSIGDKVDYQLTSKVPEMDGYKNYFFVVNDTMSPGLTFNDDVAIKIGETTLTSDQFIVTTGTDAEGNATIEIVIKNFIGYKAQAGQDIIITYSATIDENAVIGEVGNPNKVHLVYSNNPNVDTDGDKPEGDEEKVTGKTPDDVVITYVSGIKLTKVDEKNEALPGAKFQISGTSQNVVIINEKIYKEDENGTYYRLKDGTYTTEAATDQTKDQYEYTDKKYSEVEVVTKDTVETEIVTEAWVNAEGILTFEGLGEGTYTITELIAPDGYNKLDAPITVVISFDETATPKWSAVKDDVALTEGTDGLFAFDVVNKPGTSLPSTGGIGTTIFYIAGAILVVGAVVVMISKKRSSEK